MSLKTRTDQELTKSVNLPAAGATATTPSIDLGGANDAVLSDVEGRIELEAVPNLVDDKTVIATVQDSADDSSFSTLSGVGTLTQTGAGGVGAAAATLNFRFPPVTRRYVRVSVAVLAAGGANTDSEATFKIRT